VMVIAGLFVNVSKVHPFPAMKGQLI
jgi:hypothetical protein